MTALDLWKALSPERRLHVVGTLERLAREVDGFAKDFSKSKHTAGTAEGHRASAEAFRIAARALREGGMP